MYYLSLNLPLQLKGKERCWRRQKIKLSGVRDPPQAAMKHMVSSPRERVQLQKMCALQATKTSSDNVPYV